MLINGDGNWVDILNDAVITYNNNIHSTNKMTPVDASNNPDKVNTILNPPKQHQSLKSVNVDKLNIFSKRYTSN